MFVREKRIGRYTYVYLVETVREDGRIKQRIIRNLGRKEDVDRRGDLDRLARSAARLAQRSMILSLIDEGSVPALTCQRCRSGLSSRGQFSSVEVMKTWPRPCCALSSRGRKPARRCASSSPITSSMSRMGGVP